MAIFQYGSIWFNMCIYIIYHGISFISSKFCLPTRQHLTTWRRYSSRLIWVLLRTQGQHSPSHLYGDVHTSWRTGWGKQGRYKYQKKNKKYDHGPVKSSEYRWWMVMVSQLSPSWAWESGRLWRINPVHNGAHGGHMGSPLSCLFTWRSWARYSQSSCSKVSMPTIFHQHCVLFHPKKSMPLSTGGDLWTKIHLKKSHLAQGPEASS